MTVIVELLRVAHGGAVVGRSEDKVIFVTGGLPGETVAVEITQQTKRFDRGHVVEVLAPSPGRVTPPCPIADRCGGCDWQHATPELQLELKSAVVAEQLQRLAGIEWQGHVVSVGPSLGWRTRMRYAVDEEGRVGLRARRSHVVVPLPAQGCLVAAPGPEVSELAALGRGADELQVVSSADGITVLADNRLVRGPRLVHEDAAGHRFAVESDGFWQVHPRAAEVLTDAVVAGLRPSAGETALDLYCGVGLFAAPLVDAGCKVLGIEGSRSAIARARTNVPEARFIAGPMEKHLDSLPSQADIVVLDPPRKGAGASVVKRIAALGPRGIAYVACDPSALARDLATFSTVGYHPVSIEAFDLFPMTHHVECVAILGRCDPDDEK
ncbi:MAG: class I SAM-dependent RNA methyltransferase [Propionibacteriaceae bacterium]|nr:class I SAM-dependent RNA methyltransferase [Propionibacteriaceae bacterium]